MAQPRVPSVGYLVWHLSIDWRVFVDRALSPLGLTHAPYALLASLYALSRGGAKPSQRELADFAGLEVMYVSKLVRVLERSGQLRRNDHPDDPRAFQLELTVAGADLITKAAVVVGDLYEQLLAPIGGRSSKRAKALMQTLQTLLDHAQADRQKGARVSEAASQAKPVRRGRRKAS
jgi:MarR family transcriptional regulator, organic hydroperoxide resistance regulator